MRLLPHHYAVALIGLAAAPAFAQSLPPATPTVAASRTLTLEEARAMALSNKALVLARLNIEQLQHATAGAKKDYYPKVLANSTYFRFDDDLGQVLTIRRGTRGILQPGTTTIATALVNQNANLNSILVAQPITKLIAVNALVQIARADEAAAQAQLDKGTRDVLSGVSQAYHGLLGVQRIQAALELQIQLLEQLLAAKPAAELRIGLIETKQGLAQVRGQVAELTQQLDSLLDLPLCTCLVLVEPAPCELPLRCADDAAEQAVAHDPEIREAVTSIAKAEAGLKVAKLAYVPDVTVLGGVQNQSATNTIQENFGFVGVTASMTVFEWGKKKDAVRQRQAQIALAHQNVQVTSDKVRLTARKAFVEFQQAREALQLANEMVQARKEIEKAAKDAAAVVAAKAETTKAELEVMKAEIVFRVAHAKLAALVCGA